MTADRVSINDLTSDTLDALCATAQRVRDLAAYWATVPGGEQAAEAITAVMDGTHRPLPDCTPWAWAPALLPAARKDTA